MNPELKAMAEQAGIQFREIGMDGLLVASSKNLNPVEATDLEAFAKLIAADCARIARGRTMGLYGRDSNVWNQAAKQIEEAIQRKYSVVTPG